MGSGRGPLLFIYCDLADSPLPLPFITVFKTFIEKHLLVTKKSQHFHLSFIETFWDLSFIEFFYNLSFIEKLRRNQYLF